MFKKDNFTFGDAHNVVSNICDFTIELIGWLRSFIHHVKYYTSEDSGVLDALDDFDF